MENKMKEKWTLSPNFIALILLIVFFLLSYLSMLGKSPTYDEIRNYNYGKSILNGDSDRPDDRSVLDGTRISGSMMPVSALNALPLKISSYLPDGSLQIFLESNSTARLVTILFSVLTAILVFRWARSLYGAVPALFSLTFYVFDPNIIAHSQYVTNDMFTWGATLLVFYCTWRFAHERTWKYGLLWASALGISALVKYTTIILLPLSLITLFLHDLPSYIKEYHQSRAFAILKLTKHYISYLVLALVFSLLTINIGFLLNKSFIRFGDYKFSSHLLNNIQTKFPFLHNLPVPAPFPYMEGFDLTYYYGEEGLAFGNIYLLGELGDGTQGFKGYYFVASFFKEPITTQLFVLSAFFVYIKKKGYKNKFLTDEVFLLLPSLFFIIYFNFFFNINTGIRYYLVFFPLIYVFSGKLFESWDNASKTQKDICFVLIGYLIVSVLSYYPDYVPYFNEFLFDRREAYKILADSNVDYGQSDFARDEYLSQHPEAIYNPARPVSGTVVVGVNELVGVFGTADDYRWLRENFEPTSTISHTYLVYEISQDQLNALCQTTDYCK